MIARPYEDINPYTNDFIHQRWNTEWNKKSYKLKGIKQDTRPWKENDRCRENETVINRLRVGHTVLTHGYRMEGVLLPECELCHNHTTAVKHLLTECANPASLTQIF